MAWLWSLATMLSALLGPAGGCDVDNDRNEPPRVPRIPRVERLELDRFHVSWSPSRDDNTPLSVIRYEVGVVSSDACIVVSPQFRTAALTELTATLPRESEASPMVGFTVRSIDAQGDSRGYGPCSWALRSPVRMPIAIDQRRPRLRPAPAQGPAGDCQSDGEGGIWCLSDTEIAHLGGYNWETLPFPTPFEPVAWTPVDEYSALVQSDAFQLHLSRANGIHAVGLSSDSERFDGGGGALQTGRSRAFVAVRGHIGEFEDWHLDLAGPPTAANLPRSCRRVVQLAQAPPLAAAICRDEEGGHLVFLGEGERQVFRWQPFPLEVEVDHIDGLLGSRDTGLLGLTSATGGWIYAWDGDQSELIEVAGVEGQGRPILALTGSYALPFAVAARDFTYAFYNRGEWHPMALEGDEVRWRDASFPRRSHLVGGRRGIYLVSPTRTVRLDLAGAQLILDHPEDARGFRGRDMRHYLLRGPVLREALSSRHGEDWYVHPWSGPELEPSSLAVTPSGGIYVSGWRHDRVGSDVRRRPAVFKLGDEQVDLTPDFGTDPSPQPPILAADGLGGLYAYAVAGVIWRDPASGAWLPASPIPGRLHDLEGLSEGVLAVTHTDSGPRVFRCREVLCFEIPVPEAARRPLGAVIAHESGFCLGVESRALWCRDEGDDWIDVEFSPVQAERFGLTRSDRWSILDAVPLDAQRWMLAVRNEHQGFLALVDDATGQTRLLASGLTWGHGAVLVRPEETGRIVGLEVEGPVRLRYAGGRVSFPGSIYP